MTAKINLLVGPVRSGKTTALMRQYRLATQSGTVRPDLSETLWIGPDSQSVTLLKDSLLASPEEAYLGFKILTFSGYAESVVAAGSKRIRPISQLQKRRLLQLATESTIAAGQVSHYAQVVKTPGFLSQVSELIAELKRRDVWPEHLAPRCQEPREHELAAIFQRYQRYLLEHNLYDAEGRFWAARDLLSKQAPSAPDYLLIVVDGFTDFTSAQYDILRHLANRTAEMRLSLTLEQTTLRNEGPSQGRSFLFAKPAETLKRLRHIFPNLEVRTSELPSQFATPGLKHLASHLFCEPHEITSSAVDSSGLCILAANSVQQESEKVTQRIKHLLHKGLARPHEIALVYRSLEEVSPRIREALTDHGIPYAIESQTRLTATPLLRCILSLLRLRADDWPFRNLLEVVNNRLFRTIDDTEEDSAYSSDIRAAIERRVRSAQLPSGRQALFEQLKRWVEINETASSPIRQLASEASLSLWKLQQLADLLDQLPREAALTQWTERLKNLLLELGALPDENDSELHAYRSVKATWQVLQRGLRALESLDTHLGTATPALSLFDFIELVETVARDQRLSLENDPTGRVRVLSSESARHISVKYLFLAGLGEQSFASLASGNPLFDVRRLDQQPSGSVGGEIGSESLNNEAMQLFYELTTRASEQLTLSYPAMDAKGQALSPSPLLLELKRCFGKVAIQEEKASLGDFVNTESEPQSETSFRQQAVAQAIEGDQRWLAGLLKSPSQANTSKAIIGGIHCIAERGKREEFGNYDGLVLGEVARKMLSQRFDSEHLWSASQLEKYANCPFRFFGEQLLSLEAPEELALRSDALRRGSLLHQVLATLHQQLLEGKQGKSTTEQTVEDLIKRFCLSLQAAIDATPLYGLQQALREIERREIEALAPQYAQQEIDYRGRWGHLEQPPEPQFFEVRFGPKSRTGDGLQDTDSTTLPFEIDLGDEKILLTGQIDRVDIGQVAGVTVFNIIDYKSGKEVKLQADQVRAGKQLQLPLYAMAAEHLLLVDQNAIALAAGYWSIAGKGFQSGRSGALEVRQLEGRKLQTSPQWDELQPELLDRVRQIVHGIRDGQFPVYNSDENCTRSCNLATICRIAHIRSLEKQWEPPELPTSA